MCQTVSINIPLRLKIAAMFDDAISEHFLDDYYHHYYHYYGNHGDDFQRRFILNAGDK